MPPRNHKNWKKKPDVEYVDSRIYSDHNIWKEEMNNIFSKVWIPMCHISEMYDAGNFRTTQIAGENVIAYNTGEEVRAYRNYGINELSGTLSAPIVTSEPQLHCEVKHGGMVWVTLDPNPTQSVEQWTAGAFDCISDAIDTEELDIFHYSQNMIDRFYQNGREDKGKNSYIFTYSHHENLFADLSHPWGYHPVHLHRICREAVSSELFKFIENSRLDFDKKNNTLII